MKNRYRIVIAEDHTILREGLRSLLSSHEEFEIVAEAGDGIEAVALATKLKPDLVLMDLSMPRMNGMEAIREITRRIPETKILALTVHKAEEYFLAALDAGAAGYLLKDATHDELVAAIRTILAGKPFLSPYISRQVLDGYLEGKKRGIKTTAWDTLTQREREVLKLIAEGQRNKDVADILCISVKTVEKHRANLMQKLDLHSVSAMTAYAIRKGLLGQ
jgi:two-component system response regulator NreC